MYAHLGEPDTEKVRMRDGTAVSPGVPAELVAPIENSHLAHASYLQESTIVSDFGQSYAVAFPSQGYKPATKLHYFSPEAHFEDRAGLEADVWALGCAIFEIRAGFPLFESFFGDYVDVLKQTVEILGRLPDPWWNAFEQRTVWFDEDGRPKTPGNQGGADMALRTSKSSIREQLHLIGAQDDAPFTNEGRMIEPTGVRLREEEIELLGDLLEKMLKYHPEDRIKVDEVVRHPWFDYLS